MSGLLPLTSNIRINNQRSHGASPTETSANNQDYNADKNKETRKEQDRHNLMGVASIWAPRPSEKDLHAAYPVPVVSPSPRTLPRGPPSPRLSPTASAFTSTRGPAVLSPGPAMHPMLLTVPQLLQPNFIAPPLHFHDARSGHRDENSYLMPDPVALQAWFCPMCENDNRVNTETCAQ
jgi:hypothetical protein